MNADERQVEKLLAGFTAAGDEKLRAQALVRLVDGAPQVADDLSPEHALSVLCAALLKIMGCTTAVLSQLDQAGGILASVSACDVSGVRTRLETLRSVAGDAALERVVGEQVPQFVRPRAGGAGAPPVEAAVSWLALPLVHRGVTIGMLELLAGDVERRYSAAEISLVLGVCESVAAAARAAWAAGEGESPSPAAHAAEAPPNGAEQLQFSRTLADLARRLCEGLSASHCDILVRHGGAGGLKVVAHHGSQVEGPHAGAHVHEYGLGETGVRARAIDERVVAQCRDDDIGLSIEERAEMAARGEKAVMYVPIVGDDEVIGLLSVIETRVARRFSAAEEGFAQQMAWEAAVAVASARVVERVQSRNRELRLLLETGAAIAASVGLRETLSAITERLVQTLGVAWSNVYDYHPESAELEVIAYYQVPGIPEDPQWIGHRFTSGTWPEGHRCIAERAPQTKYYDYAQLSPEDFAYMESWGEKATLSVPLIHGDAVLGVLDVAESRYPRRFTDEEVRLAQAIAGQAAVAIHNAKLYEEATRRNEELATMLGAAEALSSTTDLEEVLLAVSWRIREALGSESVEVYEFDPVMSRLTHVAHAATDEYWYETPEWTGVYDLADNELLTQCVVSREPVVAYVDDPDVPEQTRDDMKKWGDTAELWLPMVYKDEVLGMVSTSEVGPERRFSPDEIRLAQGIASQGAVAIANARAYRRVEEERALLAKLNARLSAFAEVSGQMRGLVGEGELLGVTGQVMSKALGFTQWVAYIRDPERQVFGVAASVGGTAEIDEQYRGHTIPERIIRGLLADATRISHAYFVDHLVHTWTDEEHFYMPGSVEGERGDDEWCDDDTLFVPMVDRDGDLLGYLEAYDPVDRQRPGEETVRLLEIFAAKAAGAIELQRAYAELELQSRTDGLTGLYNHRTFQERLQEEVARATRTRRPLTVLMIDVDNFKEFNDTYGHPQGDKLLKALSDLLQEATRQSVDFVARYGGEEFVVLLPETGAGGGRQAAVRLHDELTGEHTAEAVAEAIRQATEERAMAGVAREGEGSVTVSIGVAVFPEHGQTPDQLVANADKALYHAKRLGKNRYAVYEG